MKKANRDAFRKWTCPILNPNHKQKVKCVNIIHSGYRVSHSETSETKRLKIRVFLQIKLLSFCAKIAPKRHKLRKIIKIEKNVKTRSKVLRS